MGPDPKERSLGDARRSEETRALCAAEPGDGAQNARLFELVYAELRRLAARCLADEREGHTLQPTALVHEAYLELVGQGDLPVKDKQRFLAIAATAMRRTLIDHARGKARAKRGGGWKRVELEPEVSPTESEPLDLGQLDRALEALRAHSEELARLVELRFFAGLPMSSVAEVMGLSERSAGREWSFARAWLQRWLEEHHDGRA
ncbi:MAG: sigma-70 family RNA polymerase sigma factor [Planctomycetes bacterium]|nr:sigma-70 family RNA polymerase sigma factor [Planctomycetota bacterium]